MTDSELRGNILDEIARRAPLYTPEWSFSPERPDAGTALAMLWADMHEETLRRFARLPDNYKRTLFDAIGSDPRPAVAANGFLAFTVHMDAGDFVIPKGSVVAASADPDAALVTSHDLAASSARFSDIYRVLPRHDSVERIDSLNNTRLLGPVQNTEHVWTFSHDFALNVSHTATLRLTPEIESGGLDVLAGSQWEYRDGDNWHKLTVVPDGSSLLCVFPENTERCGAVRASMTRDLVLRSLTAKPSGMNLFPDALYADSAQMQDGFHPFGQRFIPGACAYFTNIDALTKPGARVELSFNLSFDDFEIEGYTEAQIYMKKVMRASELKPPEEFTITASETRWEYYNGVGWAALCTDVEAALFNGDTDGRIRITFNRPNDLCETVVGAHDLPFIRVRLIGAANLYRLRGNYKTPRISDVRFAYRYSTGVPLTDIRVAEHLDAFDKTLPAHLAAPPDSPAALYFASSTAFTRGTVLFHMESGGPVGGTGWEYLTGDGWKQLRVRDETRGLCRTGLFNYQTSQPAEKARLWGREAYWLRLLLDDTMHVDMKMFSHYENAVRAEARIPGKASILPAGAYTTIVAPLASVEAAFNPVAVYGGADEEEETGIFTRLSAAISHSGRAVSCANCEELVLEASPRVQKARYYAHTDEHGNHAYGRACLVILTHDAEEFGFSALCDEIMAYITPRRALGQERLVIKSPRYIAVNVSAHLLIESYGETLTVQNRIDEMLQDMLSPMNWEIGQLPAPGQINAAIRAIPGVLRVTRFGASYIVTSGISSNYAKAANEAFVLPVNGTHEYTFIGKE